jgi:hypothetical protein
VSAARWARRLDAFAPALAARARRRAARAVQAERLTVAQLERMAELRARVEAVGLSGLTDEELAEAEALVAILEGPDVLGDSGP